MFCGCMDVARNSKSHQITSCSYCGQKLVNFFSTVRIFKKEAQNEIISMIRFGSNIYNNI